MFKYRTNAHTYNGEKIQCKEKFKDKITDNGFQAQNEANNMSEIWQSLYKHILRIKNDFRDGPSIYRN